jgi:hypothetical protein
MEIVFVILGLLLAFALATNEQSQINKNRNGFDGDDDYDL